DFVIAPDLLDDRGDKCVRIHSPGQCLRGGTSDFLRSGCARNPPQLISVFLAPRLLLAGDDHADESIDIRLSPRLTGRAMATEDVSRAESRGSGTLVVPIGLEDAETGGAGPDVDHP